MSKNFDFISQSLLLELNRVRHFIKKHNSTIGVLTEEVVREFLRRHLPSIVSVSQGFVQHANGQLSKQCDIIVYDSLAYSPIYWIGDIAIVPNQSVLLVIEVKTRIEKHTFHDVIHYFSSFDYMPKAQTHLFSFEGRDVASVGRYFTSYEHPGTYKKFDHDTYGLLPDTITSLDNPYHLRKSEVITDNDQLGYVSWFYEDEQGTAISALQLFYDSINLHVQRYIHENYSKKVANSEHVKNRRSVRGEAISLFDM